MVCDFHAGIATGGAGGPLCSRARGSSSRSLAHGIAGFTGIEPDPVDDDLSLAGEQKIGRTITFALFDDRVARRERDKIPDIGNRLSDRTIAADYLLSQQRLDLIFALLKT